jgi:hypothetical protein
MPNRVSDQWKETPPRSRLERWLLRKVQGGALRALPQYAPLGDRLEHCPEQYARALLARMQTAAGDSRALERAKDDGRAFRSWAEAVFALAG